MRRLCICFFAAGCYGLAIAVLICGAACVAHAMPGVYGLGENTSLSSLLEVGDNAPVDKAEITTFQQVFT
ncbi:MAG: hypothetical protein MK171_06595 [Pirellulales bacterium]|nr:hypothetical protein [Pirellulales bacterium]